MNTECFLQVLKHLITHTFSSHDNPSLLIMDNHESHISVEAINLCKDNGVTILAVPPHCTHRLQPLDVGLLKPFHTFYNDALCSWEKSNPGIPVTIYQVASFVGVAYPRSMTPINIAAAFKKTGIFPFDRHVFNEEDFLSSQVTERLLVDTLNTDLQPSTSTEFTKTKGRDTIPLRELSPSSKSEKNLTFVSPSDIRGYPKRTQTTSGKNRRRKGKTMIATDIPEKTEIENNKAKKAKTVKRKIMPEHNRNNDDIIESEDEDGETYSVHDSDTSVGSEIFSKNDDEDLSALTLNPAKVCQIKTNDFLLVRLNYEAVF